MITVDCSKALPIKDELLVYVADKLGALPILKDKKFMLTSINDSQIIEKTAVVTAIKEFLESKKLQESIHVIENKDTIIIETLDGNEIIGDENNVKKKQLFLECTHCGFITQYEEELRTHRLIHYI